MPRVTVPTVSGSNGRVTTDAARRVPENRLPINARRELAGELDLDDLGVNLDLSLHANLYRLQVLTHAFELDRASP